MAALPELKHGDSFEVSVALPDLEPKECPLFSFKRGKWIFEFKEENENNELYYSASLVHKFSLIRNEFDPFKFSRGCSDPFLNEESPVECGSQLFKFSYSVEIVDEANITALYAETYVNLRKSPIGCPFLQIPNSMLQDKLPYNHHGRNIFKFSFTFYLPSKPVLKSKIKSQGRCEQKVSYLNADVSVGSLSKDFSELLESGLNHDVKIKCGEHTVKAHKIVLCTRSKVFKTMLQKNFREGRTGVVEIRDMDSSSFQDFIKYIYTDLLPELTFEKAATLYETGDKYDVRGLLMRCSEYLRDNLSLENVYRCLVLADAHSDEKLKSEAISFILRNKLDLQEEHWLPFCKNYPKIAFEVYKLSRKNP